MNTATIPAETTSVNHGYVVRKPLTPEEQELATRAWHHAYPTLVKLQRKHPGHADSIESAFGIRLTTLIPTFDPDKSSLETWSLNQLRFCVYDAARLKPNDVSPRTYRAGRNSGWEGTLSLYQIYDQSQCEDRRRGRNGVGSAVTPLGVVASPDGGADDRDADETREFLIHPLSARDRRLVRMYTDGHSMKEVGESLGVSESRVSQILSRARGLLALRRRALCA